MGINSRIGLFIPFTCLLLPSCSPSISKDDCVSEYAQKGGTEQIVRWGYQLCNIATDPSKSGEDRSNALCAVKNIPSTPTELAFRQVLAECRKR
jgi:hypothetical protein